MSNDSRSTAQHGRDLVTTELERRGYAVREVLVGRRPTLLVERDGMRGRVHVSAKNRGTWQTSLDRGARVPSPELSACTWIFVDLGPAKPEFYIVPEDWMAEDIYAETQRYFAMHGGTRKYSPDSKHHAVPVKRIEQWLDCWDALEGTLR